MTRRSATLKDPTESTDPVRRKMLLGGGVAAGVAFAGAAVAQTRSDTEPRVLDGQSDAAAMITGAEYEVTGGDSAKNV